MFRKVLIANRGEIAVRVIRTLREMRIGTVAVFSTADREAQHVRLADEAVCIGPPAAAESYLRIDRLLAAARQTGAEAVHPGYGFLAENAGFAAACLEAGVAFIGPPPPVLAALGDKLEARAIAARAGVPTVPGSPALPAAGGEALAAAERIGYPLIIKAAGGGGGKGMRVVRDPGGLAPALELARAEAQSAFANPTVYLERYLERPRHVEMQILADRHGRTLWLGERECSIQRRHQKLIEESPSPAVDDDLRGRIGDAALRIIKEVGYLGAGTVEFLLDASGRFYFLEVNARLQVEHPVTEWITGLDLVREQVLIAAGEPLAFGQEEVLRFGWAIECRVCAEDPVNQFLPSTGQITGLRIPNGPFLRTDFGPIIGNTVDVHYDSLLGKIIAWGRTREEARRRLLRGIGELRVAGIVTNASFLAWALQHPCFVAGETDTGFIARHFQPEVLTRDLDLKHQTLITAAIQAFADRRRVREPREGEQASPWRMGGRRWR